MNRKPRIPKALKRFTGCEVGFPRCGSLPGVKEFEENQTMVEKGYLQVVPNPECCTYHKRVWFALAPKGKAIVAKLENYYAGKF